MPPRREIVEDVFLHKEAWRTTFRGCDITSVAVRDRNIVYLALLRIPQKPTCDGDTFTRATVLFLDEQEKRLRWGHQELRNFHYPISGTCLLPIGQGLTVSRSGDTFASGSQQQGLEKIGPEDPNASDFRSWNYSAGVKSVRCIEGRAFAAASGTCYSRIGIGKWDMLPQDGLPTGATTDFEDIDGFSRNDLYATSGDVWRFDGTSWKSCNMSQRIVPGEPELGKPTDYRWCFKADGLSSPRTTVSQSSWLGPWIVVMEFS